MFNKESTTFTFAFATVLTVVCSLILGAASQGLKDKQEVNADIDVKSKVLQALSLYNDSDKKLDNQTILNYFKAEGVEGASIEKIALDNNGQILQLTDLELTFLKLRKEMKKDQTQRRYPVYLYYSSIANRQAQKVDAYILPIQGPGLWDICYGFLALEADASTIKALIYYEHKETPGLGAEIKDNADWVAQFPGKSILDTQGKLAAPQSTKDATLAQEANHYMAINGATFTLNGVNDMLTDFVAIYDQYLKTKRPLNNKQEVH